MKVTLSHPRKRYVIESTYNNDLIVLAKNTSLCRELTLRTNELLQSLGFIINWEKSQSQHNDYRFLGFALIPSILECRQEKTIAQKLILYRHIKSEGRPMITKIARLLGLWSPIRRGRVRPSPFSELQNVIKSMQPEPHVGLLLTYDPNLRCP